MNIIFLSSLIYTLFYVFVNILLGLIFLKLLFRRQLVQYQPLIVLATSFLLGQGIFFALWQLLGLVGQFKITVIWGILILIILIGVPFLRELFWFIKKTSHDFWLTFKKLQILWKFLLSLVFLLIIFFAAGSIIQPPAGDAEAFYMVLPKIMAQVGILKPQPNYYEFSKIGLFGEMHLAALMVIANQAAAKFFVWFTALAAAGVLISIGTLAGIKTKGKIIALAILFTSSTFTNYITDGKMDVFSAALGLAAYYWVLETKRKNWLPIILVGLFLGYSIVAKLSNTVVIIPGILLVLGWNHYLDVKSGHKGAKIFFKQSFVSLIILSVLLVVALIPQFIKNKVLFNKPFSVSDKYENFQWAYPIWSASKILYSFKRPAPTPVPSFSPVFHPTPTPTPLALSDSIKSSPQESNSIQTPAPVASVSPKPIDIAKIQNGFITFLTYPFAYVFGNRPGQGGNLSVLMIAFLPFLFLMRPLKLIQKQVLAMGLLGLAIWLVVRSSATTPRYILPTLLLFIPVITTGAEYILDRANYFLLKITIVGSIFLTVLVFLFIHFNMFVWFGSVTLGRSSPTTYYGPYYPGLAFINQKANTGDRIFLVGYYGYFLDANLLANIDNNQEKLDIIFFRQAAPWEYIYNHGFKYIVVQKAPQLLVEDDLQVTMPDWLNIQKIYSDPITDIYSLEKK